MQLCRQIPNESGREQRRRAEEEGQRKKGREQQHRLDRPKERKKNRKKNKRLSTHPHSFEYPRYRAGPSLRGSNAASPPPGGDTAPVSAPSRSSTERRSRAEAKAGEGKDPGLRRGKSEPRSSADDSVGSGKPEEGGSAFSRVGVARAATKRRDDAVRLVDDAAREDEEEEGTSADARLLLLMERSGVAADAAEEELDAIIAERLLLLLRATQGCAIFSLERGRRCERAIFAREGKKANGERES